jgi:hypothetical protein
MTEFFFCGSAYPFLQNCKYYIGNHQTCWCPKGFAACSISSCNPPKRNPGSAPMHVPSIISAQVKNSGQTKKLCQITAVIACNHLEWTPSITCSAACFNFFIGTPLNRYKLKYRFDFKPCVVVIVLQKYTDEVFCIFKNYKHFLFSH